MIVLADSMGWLTPVIIVAVFGVIVLAVILVKKHVKPFQNEEKPKSDKEVAQEELDRILQPVEDDEAKNQMQEYENNNKKK
ncbi:MAG: hypothetical protein ACI4UT_03990 [Candidatus Enteromonas sp.]